MAAAGKTIHDLQGKVDVMAEVLFSRGRIGSGTRKALAALAGISYRTLQSALPQGRLSGHVELKLCEAGRFSPTEAAWCDLTRSEAERRRSPHGYDGADRIELFREMLQGVWHSRPARFRARTREIAAPRLEFASHAIKDTRQDVPFPAEFPLLLEASFGSLWADDIRYGLRKAQVRLSLNRPSDAEFHIIGGRMGGCSSLGRATLTSRGTSELPCWDICADGDSGILDGEYVTADSELVRVTGYCRGTTLVSDLYADVHDGFVVIGPEVGDLCENQRAIIEALCVRELADESRRTGLIRLCHQELELTEIDDA
jgi:hypothetical protein